MPAIAPQLELERPAGFDGTTTAGEPCMLRVLPTFVVTADEWAPLPASEPGKLLATAQRSTVQRLQLCLSLRAAPASEQHPELVAVELRAKMVSHSDPFFVLTGTWYTEQAVLQAGVASSEALAAKAEALSALVDEVSVQRLRTDDAARGVCLSCAKGGIAVRLTGRSTCGCCVQTRGGCMSCYCSRSRRVHLGAWCYSERTEAPMACRSKCKLPWRSPYPRRQKT
jgi:hypothetical protein|eukprot:COSAG06_NODE_550_length_14402_cov_4.593092_2_plen_226_part_00